MPTLREQAASDLRKIVEDDQRGFGWAVVLVEPDGTEHNDLKGTSTDITQMVDPETGMLIVGRFSKVSLTIASILESGSEIPKGEADSRNNPWVIKFNDLNANQKTFKVSQSQPDYTLGLVTLILEAYVE